MSKARELSQLGDKIDIDDTTGDFAVDTDTLYVDVSADNVGIGQAPSTFSGWKVLEMKGGTSGSMLNFEDDSSTRVHVLASNSGSNLFRMQTLDSSAITFETDNTERVRIDSSGRLLVGKTATSQSTAGGTLEAGSILACVSGGQGLRINRLSTDGDFIQFRQDGASIGAIGVVASDQFYFAAADGAGMKIDSDNSMGCGPCNAFGNDLDNSIDLGRSGNRWDDVYATNGTIQTSDENEKQQIASLTDAEMTAAKAISKLFKTFKWNDKVEAKGDAARTHTGVIAQQVETAMSDAGLDAGNYAFFISTTWWETQTEVAAVAADEENGIEAQEAYTRTDTYSTLEEAPEGATERNRKGIRYPELLSFIGAATEQRLTSIEARLDALEA